MAWLVPDLGLATAVVTLFYCLFIFHGYQELFRDSDAGWHIRTGEAILATRTLPRTDRYSFSRPGQPWVAWEWAADVAVGAIHRVAGLRGVALFYGGVIAAGVWLWFRLHWAMDGDFLVACVMAPLVVCTCSIHWLARPHVIGWLFLMGAVLYGERVRAGKRTGWHEWPVVAVFMAAWANIHASFFLGPAVAGIYGVGALMGRWTDRTRVAWRYGALLAIAAIAPLANPYGWRLYAHVLRYLTDSELLARIREFQSFDFHSPGAGMIVATLMVGISGGALALVCRRYEHFLLAVIFSALALRSARALPLAALLLLPVANGAIREIFPLPWKGYAERLRAIDRRWKGYALAPFALAAAFGLLGALPAGFPPAAFPVAAYPHIPADARLFAPDLFGGYLIYRSNGTRQVYFDGRSDFYGVEFLKQYGRMVQLRAGWREDWESYHFSHALMPLDFPLAAALEEMGWRRVYQDGTVVLLARQGT